MRYRAELVRALTLMPALLQGPSPLMAQADRTQWKLANFTWVTRVPAEPGVPANDHPARVSRERIQAALASVQTRLEGGDAPLFEAKELAALAKALEEALAVARPAEDLVLLSTQRRGGHFLDPAFGVTARLFLKEGSLNLLVHDARLDFMGRYSADRTLPTFAYGSRKTLAPASIHRQGATQVRPDWLAIPLALATPAVAPAADPPPPAPETEAGPGEAPRRGQEFYDQQSQRLKALKRMREENLITEREYQEKREAILKTL